MHRERKQYQYYIGIGLIVNSIAYLLFENGMLIHSVKSCLLIVGISLEIIGLIKYRRSCNHQN